MLNLEWLSEDSLIESNRYTKWYHFDNPLTIILNGTTGDGEIYKPKDKKIEIDMNEEESTGI